MRRLVLACPFLVACSGDPVPGPETAPAPSTPVEVAAPAETSAGGEPVAPSPVRLVERGETDGEMQAGLAREAEQGETEGDPAAAGRPTEPPPPAQGEQPVAPDAEAGPRAEANLDPEHLQQVREANMTEREQRAARARAARKAYEH